MNINSEYYTQQVNELLSSQQPQHTMLLLLMAINNR